MKKGFRFLSLLIAVFMILGSISFNNFSLAEGNLGSLKVHKMVDGNAGFDRNDEFTFNLKGDPSDQNTNHIDQNRTLVKNSNQGNEVNFDDLPYGWYILTETDFDEEKYEFDYITNKNKKDDLGSMVYIDGPEIQRWVMNKTKGSQEPTEPKYSLEINKIV